MGKLFTLLLSVVLAETLSAQVPVDHVSATDAWPEQTLAADSGLRIWEYPSADETAFHMAILVGVGSRDESPRESGISHLLEHSLFLSTDLRSEAELTEDLRRIGGQSNGQTTVDWTAYWVSVPASQWRFGVDWLTEQLARPKFVTGEVLRERGIVIEELNTRHAHGAAPVLERLLFGDHPLGHSIGGTEATVSRLNTVDVEDWYAQYYRQDNLVVAFSGDVPGDEVAERIQGQLAGLATDSAARDEHELEPRFGPGLIGSGDHAPNDRKGFLYAGHLAEPTNSADLAALLIANRLLSDAVMDEVRTNRGLAYSPNSELVINDDIWRLACRIEVGERDNLPAVLAGVELAFAGLARGTEEKYLRAKSKVLASLVVTGAGGLMQNVERTWALRELGSATDLKQAVGGLSRSQFAVAMGRLLPAERQFVLSDSVGVARPETGPLALLLTLFVLVVLAVLYFPRSVLPRWLERVWPRGKRSRGKRQAKGALLQFPGKRDLDDLERDFGAYFDELDDKGE
ncbi:MAG: putative Zn-dependent peptidase [Planctomycetota bacterium]|jgi:predicted Zn-dependent peptidase